MKTKLTAVKRIYLLIPVLLLSCIDSSSNISSSSYPELDELFEKQALASGRLIRIQKEVWLDGSSEKSVIEMDSLTWTQELSFLNDINPNLPRYQGVFEEDRSFKKLVLKMKEGEKGTLKNLSVSYNPDARINITAVVVEDKKVFEHRKNISVNFQHGFVTNYEVIGSQKIVSKDPIKFRVVGKVQEVIRP